MQAFAAVIAPFSSECVVFFSNCDSHNTHPKFEESKTAVIAGEENNFSRKIIVRPRAFCASPECSINTVDFNFLIYGKVKSAYGPMWPTRPELIPVSVA